jgi:hypothetical protein
MRTGDIEALVDEVHEAVGEECASLQRRMKIEKLEQQRRDVPASEQRRRRDGERAARLVADAAHRRLGRLQFTQDAAAVDEEGLARFREAQAARGPLQQQRPEMALERCDGACRRRRRNLAPARAGHEAAALGDGHEGAQALQMIDRHSCSRWNCELPTGPFPSGRCTNYACVTPSPRTPPCPIRSASTAIRSRATRTAPS